MDEPTERGKEAIIAAMNQAESDYDHAPDRDAKNNADKMFCACWDWLTEHNVPFYRDHDNRVYKVGHKPT